MAADTTTTMSSHEAYFWRCLDYYAFDEAQNLADLLYAADPSDSNCFLRATALYRQGNLHEAMVTIENNGFLRSARLRFLLGRIYADCGDPIKAELVLGAGSGSELDSIRKTYRGAMEPFALQLIGHCARLNKRLSLAQCAHEEAFSANPLLWSCFAQLCQMEIERLPEPEDVFDSFMRMLYRHVMACGDELSGEVAVVVKFKCGGELVKEAVSVLMDFFVVLFIFQLFKLFFSFFRTVFLLCDKTFGCVFCFFKKLSCRTDQAFEQTFSTSIMVYKRMFSIRNRK